MKKSTVFIPMLFIATALFAKSPTSVSSGNWTNPLIWDCTCIPLPGDTITINHNVTLNTDFAYTSGSITINSSGALNDDVTGRALWINGGAFTNAGSADITSLLADSGSFSNSGTLTATAFANFIDFNNTGSIVNVDSLYNDATLINNGSMNSIDSIRNLGNITNNGYCLFNDFTNHDTIINNNVLLATDVTNLGLFENADSMELQSSFWNFGSFYNQANAYFKINNNFVNNNIVTHDALFINDGVVNIMDSWYNMDTIRGNGGSFTVVDSSYNSGFLKDTFDFCDDTPPMTEPYIDINLGSVSSRVSW
jgi:hypothetical protein